MKNFVLNLLNILAWIFEILFGVVAALLLVGDIIELFNGASLAKTMGFTSNVGANLAITYSAVLLAAILMGAIAWTIREMRLLIRNIKHGVYFERENLNLLHSSLISISIFTIVSIILSIMTGIGTTFLNTHSPFNLNFNFSDAIFSLVVLMIVYVIYLVFKNGLELQEERDKNN